MEKLKKIGIILLPIILVTTLLFGIFYNQKSIKIGTICKKLQLIDINIDHNQALDVIETAKENQIEIPDTVINFDTHSDLYVYEEISPKLGAEIYNWINELVIKNPEIETIYWVMPKGEATNAMMQYDFKQRDIDNIPIALEGNNKKNEDDVNPNVHQKAYTQDLIINTNNGYLEELAYKKDYEKLKQPNYKKFKLITCTEETLPNFKNKKVFLSIDMDYLSNSGFDTSEDWSHNLKPQEVEQAYNKMITTIRNKNIQPQIISLTLSPQYIPKSNEKQIQGIMEEFLYYSKGEDIIKEYTRRAGKPQVRKGQKKYKEV